MAFAMDLSSRQTARTIEQAIRHHARVVLRALARTEDELISCRIRAIESGRATGLRRPCLALHPHVESALDETTSAPCEEPGTPDTRLEYYTPLIGTYCDATLYLGESRYLFSTDVLAATCVGPSDEVRLLVACPETLQVAQRRRFWRFCMAASSQVQLSWTNPDGTTGAGVGWLCNVGADGIACRASVRVADQLGIGEQVKVDFALAPGDPQRFCLPATLCNKTPAGTKNTTILGMQFLAGPGFDASRQIIEKLRDRLLSFNDLVVKTRKGARP